MTLLESLYGLSTSAVLHEGLVTLLESLYGLSTSAVLHEGLVTLLESLCGPSTSAVLHEGLVTLLESLCGPSTSAVLHEGLVTLLESLLGPSTSAVLQKGEVGQSFRTLVGVRQGRLLSPLLLKLYLENIMQEAIHNVNGTVSINGREISNLRFAGDIDLITGTEEELQELTTLERRARAYGMEISAEKSKIIVNSRIAPRTTI